MYNVSPIYYDLKLNHTSSSRNFAILKICIENDDLNNIYSQRVVDHNKAFLNNRFADSGFDLLVPETAVFTTEIDAKFIDMGVKCEMVYCDLFMDQLTTCAYTVHPRSSLSKTPLMLANHTGIIDAGYRGSIIGAFRWLRSTMSTEFSRSPTTYGNSGSGSLQYVVEKHTRLVQICHPTLCPIFVVIVPSGALSGTERGENGFGSTGL